MVVTPIGSLPVVVALVAMVIVAVLLTLLVIAVIRRYGDQLISQVAADLRTDLRTDLQRHAEAVNRHAELSSALELVKQYRADPELAAKLAGLSRETVLAVLTLRVTALRGDITVQQQRLSTYRRDGFSYGIPDVVRLLEALQEELRIADQAVQEFAARDGAPS